MPYRRLLGVAVAHFGWTPNVFWRATPHEFAAGIEMWRVRHGAAPDPARRAQFARFKSSLARAGIK